MGLLLCYLLGTLWLKMTAQLSIKQALLTGVAPFAIFDMIKICIVLFVGPVFRRHMKKSTDIFCPCFFNKNDILFFMTQ